MADDTYHLTIVGAGVNGLFALFHATKDRSRRVALVEQFDPGHERGSSHGWSRVTRSAYVHADYVRLMQTAHGEGWPELERSLGVRLLHRIEGCFFGPPESDYPNYARAVASVGADVDEVTADEARSRFPQFTFPGCENVLIDKTGGLIAARDTIRGLSKLADERAEIFPETRVTDIDASGDPIRVVTPYRTILTERVIVTAGPWATRLIPQLARRVQVARQTVGYVELAGPVENYQPGTFPVWCAIGSDTALTYYGLPEYGCPGIKVARHIVRDSNDDPDDLPDAPTDEAIEDIQTFVARNFVPDLVRLVDTEFCHYTNTSTEDFILDHHPDDRRIVIGSGFSGHGFKFAPVTGRILADLALDGACDLPEFVQARGRFSLKGSST